MLCFVFRKSIFKIVFSKNKYTRYNERCLFYGAEGSSVFGGSSSVLGFDGSSGLAASLGALFSFDGSGAAGWADSWSADWAAGWADGWAAGWAGGSPALSVGLFSENISSGLRIGIIDSPSFVLLAGVSSELYGAGTLSCVEAELAKRKKSVNYHWLHQLKHPA